MSRKLLLYITLLCCTAMHSYGQRYDNTWMWQLGEHNSHPLSGASRGIFPGDTGLYSQKEYLNMPFHATFFSISHPQTGNVLLYSNGFKVHGGNLKPIAGGDTINFAPRWELGDSTFGGMRIPNTSVIVPYPGKEDSMYFLFHAMYVDPTPFWLGEMRYSVMRVTNDTDGMVLIRDRVFTASEPGSGNIAACKHGNGRDWWLSFVEADTNCIHLYLLTPDTFMLHSTHCQGSGILSRASTGKSVYSQDGSLFAWMAKSRDVTVFDFDRCSGQFTNYRAFPSYKRVQSGSTVDYSISMALSPNGRFLYQPTNIENFVMQYDLHAPDINASRKVVGSTAGWVDTALAWTGLPMRLFNIQLAPDGRLYISPSTYQRFLNPINKPDLPDTACEFVCAGTQLSTFMTWTLGNFPNYRLGRKPGSACDTLYNTITNAGLHSIYGKAPTLQATPNPTQAEVHTQYNWVEWERYRSLSLQVTDLAGRSLLSQAVPPYSSRQTLSLQTLPAGLYLLLLTADGNTIAQCKVVKE